MDEARNQIKDIREDSPSMNENFIHSIWQKCLTRATKKAELETGLAFDVFNLSWQAVFEQKYV